jgi:hypothetical protein
MPELSGENEKNCTLFRERMPEGQDHTADCTDDTDFR